jgi:hypothetical protein
MHLQLIRLGDDGLGKGKGWSRLLSEGSSLPMYVKQVAIEAYFTKTDTKSTLLSHPEPQLPIQPARSVRLGLPSRT